MRVVVDDFADRRPVRFAAEVVPILTKLGCNAGACHGKASGQNGFRLSLLGFDPRLDYESLVRDGRGRRVFPAAPGGEPDAAQADGADRRTAAARRLDVGLARVPHDRALDRPGDAVRVGGRAAPDAARGPARASRVVPRQGTQQLRVVARYADGATADVTRLAQYQSNAADLAVVDDRGRVRALDGVGEAAIMARFGGQVAVARADDPARRRRRPRGSRRRRRT